MSYANRNPRSKYTGILLCGGKGARIESVTSECGNVPKPLLEVGGEVLLGHTLRSMARAAVTQLVFAVDHKAEQVEKWVGSACPEQNVVFTRQTDPGVLNAILSAISATREGLVVISNTDEIRHGFDLSTALAFHESQPHAATLVTACSKNLARHRVVSVDMAGIVIDTEKQPVGYLQSPEAIGLVNAGMIISDTHTVLSYADASRGEDWDNLLNPLVEAGQLNAYIDGKMSFFNVGTPQEYLEAQEFLGALPL